LRSFGAEVAEAGGFRGAGFVGCAGWDVLLKSCTGTVVRGVGFMVVSARGYAVDDISNPYPTAGACNANE